LAEGAAYVKDKFGAVQDSVRDYTERPLGEWTDNLTGFIRERPLLGAAALIVTGYMAAKFLRR
jgi:hypothetical protein